MRIERPVVIASVLLGIGLTAPRQSWGQARLACQVRLANNDCSEFTGTWPATRTLELIASCQECTGGGADLNCGTEEMVRAEDLGLEKAAGPVAVPGTFTQLKLCIGLPLFRFGGTLESGQSYNLFADISGHGKVSLLQFTTAGGTTTTDAGGTTTTDATTTTTDGGSTSGDAASSSGDGHIPTGDGGGVDGDDGGCGCSSAGSLPALPWPLMVLGLAAVWRRRARRR
jgi:MYXO-CTERM domain-containing protein